VTRDVRLRRVHDPPGPAAEEGFRVLVDRVWPRGIRKDRLDLDAWLRELAPSEELRRWFGHRPERWEDFRDRYLAELGGGERGRLLEELEQRARRGPITLLYGARDPERNQAVVIRDVLWERVGRGPRGGPMLG
jgi:uncharacterized protein YeaO (DUF488 family)